MVLAVLVVRSEDATTMVLALVPKTDVTIVRTAKVLQVILYTPEEPTLLPQSDQQENRASSISGTN